MTRDEFEHELKDFIESVEFHDGISYELDPEIPDEPHSGYIVVSHNVGGVYHVPVRVYGHGSVPEEVGISTWEDSYLELSRESLYAWLWLETVQRIL